MRLTLMILVLGLFHTVHAQPITTPIYRCTDASGRGTVQDETCIGATQAIIGTRPLNRAEKDAAAVIERKKEVAAQQSADAKRKAELDALLKAQLEIEQRKDAVELADRKKLCGDKANMQPAIGVDINIFRICRDRLWAPSSVRTSQSAYVTTEDWHYGGGRVIVFTNGKLTHMSE